MTEPRLDLNRVVLAVAFSLILPLGACGQAGDGQSNPEVPWAVAREAAVAMAWDETSEAGIALMATLEEAAKTERLVFLHSGAPWCSWCKRLEAWLVRDDIHPIFSKDFIAVKIDVEEEEMGGGEALVHSYNDGYGGVPWLAILKPDGSVVVTSDDPERGNIGSPRADWEIDHWNVMMRASVERITEEEVLYMAETLAEDQPDR